jgi:hypothetical protein
MRQVRCRTCDRLLVSPGRTVCRSVHMVSHLEGSSEVVRGYLPSCWSRCYTTATWWRFLLITTV